MNDSTTIPVITLDGPGGSGKGTISQKLAHKLGWHFLDSGALYRVTAYWCAKRQIDPDDKQAVATAAEKLPVRFAFSADLTAQILLEQEDISDAIRTEAMGNLASKISAYPAVRKALVKRQHDFRQPPGLVADGRDMGTVIFPDAILKIYLEASIEERAKRRYKQLQQKGLCVSLDSLLQEIADRDKRDKNREISPLKPADDAILIDTTELSVEAVYMRVLAEARSRLGL